MSGELACGLDTRRHVLVASARWNGIDYVEVADDQRSLLVYFFAPPPQGLGVNNVRIEGGRRIAGIAVTSVTPGAGDDERGADSLRVALDRYGDFSTYTLRLVAADKDAPPAGIDPRYASVDFSFKIDCPNDFDCAAAAPCVGEPAAALDIDYLAKDYESFRQLLLDRLATTMPQWRERHVPDLGITLVELLAYTADQLSAYQDAVATEAYLDTARTRMSVRRHARLVDYRLHEGCNARAWLTLECERDCQLPRDAYFVTTQADIAALGGDWTRAETALAAVPLRTYEVFEQACTGASDTALAALHSRLVFHTWGDEECCLRTGATRATLVDPAPVVTPSTPASTPADVPPAKKGANVSAAVPAAVVESSPRLKTGDVLIFEEVLGPHTGSPADADPTHRQAVRLTRVEYTRDELLDVAIIEIEWAPAEALRFMLCLSARLDAPDCRRVDGISIACGNVILVDHGRWVRGEALGCVDIATTESSCGCDGVVPESNARPAPFAPQFINGPLTCAQPLECTAPAASALEQDPRLALPLVAIGAASVATVETETWRVRSDLLASGGDAYDVVVEIDDDGRGHLRFGDGRCGRAPTPGTCFRTDYRIGVATAGNVPREAIAYVVFRANTLDGVGLRARNPLPARGGVAPESLAAARLAAPRAFRAKLERAITADDYAQLAQSDSALQRAHAHLEWTGSWYEADVAVDPLGTEEASPGLVARIAHQLECARRAGHDLIVRPARYVPLAITLHVCVKPDHLAGQIASAVLNALGNGLRADGKPAFFHPDKLSFGTDVYASDLITAAQAVEGVQNVEVTELRRLDRPQLPGPVPDALDLAAWEIARVDGDPSFPEHGVLKLDMGVGR